MILDSPYISGSIVIENSLTASNAVFNGDITVTGEINSTGGFTGSLEGTASYALEAISSSYALTASYSENVPVTASYAISASQAIDADNAINASSAISSSYAATASYADNFIVKGTLTAQTLVVTTVSSSVVYSSGSNIFGNDLSNTQQFTGSLQVTGSSHYIYGDIAFYSGSMAVGNVTGSGIIGRIDASNDVVAFSTSDENLKGDIIIISNAIDKVMSLDGVEFNWKQEYKNIHGYDGKDVGVIAQQVQAVLPEAVRNNDTGYLSVRYEKIIPLLIEAIKEQQHQINLLKSKL